MSFWNHFGFQQSAIDSLLEKADVTLEQLMDDPDLIQECKSQNRKLIEFCVQKSTLEKIVNYVVEVPTLGDDEKRRVKYPTSCTEILCAEVWQFSDAIYNNTELLKKLYSFFEMDPESMNPDQEKVANNCAKCISSLLHRKGAETLKFLRGYPKIVERFIDHVRNPSILEYILKLIGDDDPHGVLDELGEGQPFNEDAGTVNWLCEEKFIELLVNKFVTSTNEETQQSAGLMLFELASNLSPESAIIAQLESIEMVDKLFTFITNPGTISEHRSISLCGFSTLIELLRKRRVSQYQDEMDPDKLPTLVVAVSSHLADCKEFLIHAPLMPAMPTTYGLLDPPLGLARQSVLELVESLALTNSAFVFKSLLDSRFMETAIDLFFKYPWNNFAHQSVFNIIATVLPEPYKELSQHILRDCHLVNRILEAEEENKKFMEKNKAALGYIGHLTKISSLINSLADREIQDEVPDRIFASEVEKNQAWEDYRADTLSVRNERESVLLGGARPGVDLGEDWNDPSWTHEEDDSDSDDVDDEVVVGQDYDEEEPDDVEDEEHLEEEVGEEEVDVDDSGEIVSEDLNEYNDEEDTNQVQEREEEAPLEEEKKEEETPVEEEKKEEEAPAEEEKKEEEEAPKEEEPKEEAPKEEEPKEEAPKEEEPKEEAPKEEEPKEEAPKEEEPKEEAPKEEETKEEEEKKEAADDGKKEEEPKADEQ